MSQEKVDRYKEEKANRKTIMKKERRARWIRNSIMTLIGVALIAWLGNSAYSNYEKQQPRETQTVMYDEFEEYVNGLSE